MHFKILLTFFIFSAIMPITGETETKQIEPLPSNEEDRKITVNFEDVSMIEFLKFVSKISGVNFIYDENLLNFKVSVVTGKPTPPESILKILISLLQKQGIKAERDEEYFSIRKMEEWEINSNKNIAQSNFKDNIQSVNELKTNSRFIPYHEFEKRQNGDFHVYKLQYHPGPEILNAIKKVALDSQGAPEISVELVKAIQSMQWMESTNSLVYSANEKACNKLKTIIESLDVPKKQVFIEILVIETDVRNGLDFGLEWGAGGQYKSKLGYGLGNFPVASKGSPSFAETFKGINAANTPTGTEQIPLGSGYDLGIIGDIIKHKGESFFSLASLVSALEIDAGTNIILNQKIMTQDNKLSSIFVGVNYPYIGSTVETVGASQQTASNLEYRDVGVKLDITPLLGDGDTITLNIKEEVSEIIDQIMLSGTAVTGVETTKTDMNTQVHVPDNSFLVLSGMIRNTNKSRTTGVPCLGGLPLIGAAFSKNSKKEEKRNVIVFVKPQIVHSSQEYQTITASQLEEFKEQITSEQTLETALKLINNKTEVSLPQVDSQ